MSSLSSAPPPVRKVSTTLLILSACVLGAAISLFGMNYWHATRCAESHSSEEVQTFLDSVNKRILTAESQTIQNALLMERVISSLQMRLVTLESEELDALSHSSQDEAVRVALLLASQPAPIQPFFDLDPKYLDAEVLADKIDDVLGKVEDGGDDTDDARDKTGGVLGLDDLSSSSSHKWAKLDDDRVEDGKGGASTLLSDAEAIKLCKEWKTKYSVAVGISWGNLPYDLQQRWLKTKCDVYLNTNADFEGGEDGKEDGLGFYSNKAFSSPSPASSSYSSSLSPTGFATTLS